MSHLFFAGSQVATIFVMSYTYHINWELLFIHNSIATLIWHTTSQAAHVISYNLDPKTRISSTRPVATMVPAYKAHQVIYIGGDYRHWCEHSIPFHKIMTTIHWSPPLTWCLRSLSLQINARRRPEGIKAYLNRPWGKLSEAKVIYSNWINSTVTVTLHWSLHNGRFSVNRILLVY